MEPYLLARIAVRIVAIYVIAQGIMYLPSMYTALSYSGASYEFDVSAVAVIIAAIFGPLIVGIILWVVAPAVSKSIIGDVNNRKVEAGATIDQYQAVAISTAGLVIVFISLPGFISLLVQAFGGSYEFEGQKTFDINVVARLLASGLKVLFGVLLVLGVRFWVQLLHRFKEFGLEEKSSNKAPKPTQ